MSDDGLANGKSVASSELIQEVQRNVSHLVEGIPSLLCPNEAELALEPLPRTDFCRTDKSKAPAYDGTCEKLVTELNRMGIEELAKQASQLIGFDPATPENLRIATIRLVNPALTPLDRVVLPDVPLGDAREVIQCIHCSTPVFRKMLAVHLDTCPKLPPADYATLLAATQEANKAVDIRGLAEAALPLTKDPSFLTMAPPEPTQPVH